MSEFVFFNPASVVMDTKFGIVVVLGEVVLITKCLVCYVMF